MTPRRVSIVGAGRAGGSFEAAIAAVDGWEVVAVTGSSATSGPVVDGVDLVLIATPDDVVGGVARHIATRVDPQAAPVVAHVAGSLGLEALGPQIRPASLHPLAALPDVATGTRRLLGGATFAVAGDELVTELVGAFGGRAIEVGDEVRAAYHAAAVVASNHLVALLGQVERLAGVAGVPVDAYWPLVMGTVDNVVALGPAAALTGPAARGDEATLERHRQVLEGLDAARDDDRGLERAGYDAVVELARLLANRRG